MDSNNDHMVILGVSIADQSIPWPARGSAEKHLAARPGWEKRSIPVMEDGVPSNMEGMCRGELAVNRMLGGDEGFAICLNHNGWRLSYNGSVFARSVDAMKAAEEMMARDEHWRNVASSGYSNAQREVLRDIIKAAEKRGEILLDRVFPR